MTITDLDNKNTPLFSTMKKIKSGKFSLYLVRGCLVELAYTIMTLKKNMTRSFLKNKNNLITWYQRAESSCVSLVQVLRNPA